MTKKVMITGVGGLIGSHLAEALLEDGCCVYGLDIDDINKNRNLDAAKVNKNFFLCCLVSCCYAAINIPTHNSFGQAIIPYLFYLSVFKENLKIKHYLIIIFFGLIPVMFLNTMLRK